MDWVEGYTFLKASIDLIKMKIDKKLIKELVGCLSEFNITEIEYQDGIKKLKSLKRLKLYQIKGYWAVVSPIKAFCLIMIKKV